MSMPDDDLSATAWIDPDERDPEAPDADAAEQATPADPGEEPADVRFGTEVRLPPEVSEYDALEQAQAAVQDDEYR